MHAHTHTHTHNPILLFTAHPTTEAISGLFTFTHAHQCRHTMYTHTHRQTDRHTHTHMHKKTHTLMYAYNAVRTTDKKSHINTDTQNTHSDTHTDTFTDTPTHTSTFTDTHIHTDTQAHMHTHTCTPYQAVVVGAVLLTDAFLHFQVEGHDAGVDGANEDHHLLVPLLFISAVRLCNTHSRGVSPPLE